MNRSLIKLAWRNILRNRTHSLINILGLTLGLSVCIAMLQIIIFEYAHNNWHTDSERIARIYTQFSGWSTSSNPGIAVPAAQAIDEEIEGLDLVVPIYDYRPDKIEVADSYKQEKFLDITHMAITTTDYFKLIPDYKWLHGDHKTALKYPNQIVLTEDLVRTYFSVANIQDAMGKEIILEDSLKLKVSGIVQSLNRPSDFSFTHFVSYPTLLSSWLKNTLAFDAWGNTNSSFQVWTKLQQNISAQFIEKQLDNIKNKYISSNDKYNKGNRYLLQFLGDVHFDLDKASFDSNESAINKKALSGLLLITLALLFIATINFINISTAQALERRKSVGVLKVLGSNRANIRRQFFAETFIISGIATLLAIGLIELYQISFKTYYPEFFKLSWWRFYNPLLVLSIWVLISILAAWYPAQILSRFSPADALRNLQTKFFRFKNSNWVRKTLVTFQYIISLILIVSVLIIGKQLSFLINKDVGFKKEGLISFRTPVAITSENSRTLQNQIESIPGVVESTNQLTPPLSNGWSTSMAKIKSNGKEEEVTLYMKYGYANYAELYDIPLLAGRYLKERDSLKTIINKSFAKSMGYDNPNECISATFQLGDDHYTVVGVTNNFHHQSLHYNINPLAIMNDKDNRSFCVSLDPAVTPERQSEILKTINDYYSNWFPDHAFSYYYIDEIIESFYKSEIRIAQLTRMGTLLAVFVSCIGLFGLISVSLNRRIKEIGIRKTLGASTSSILLLMAKEYLYLIVIACLIAFPISWYLMKKWFEDFAYHININIMTYFLSAGIIFALAMITISARSFNAANANPVESLRNE